MFQRIKNATVFGKGLFVGIGLAHIVYLMHVHFGNGEPKILGNFGQVLNGNVRVLSFVELYGTQANTYFFAQFGLADIFFPP